MDSYLAKTVLLIGTLDTKPDEYTFVRARFHSAGLRTIMVNVGVLGDTNHHVDVTNFQVAVAGDSSLQALRESHDRGHAITVMTLGATLIVQSLFSEGKFDGIFALGGSSGSTIASASMRLLPIGFPKVLVSTLVTSSGAAFVGDSDIALFASVVDIAGINSLSSQIISHAVDSMIGMLNSKQDRFQSIKKLIAASMFGVTTECVTDARKHIESHGFEVITFHMTGSGGRSMEKLISEGFIDGVLDVTTTEICDEIVGGVLSAGPNRLTAGSKQGIPQVISLGALDMVNFAGKNTVPAKFSHRQLYSHNENVTLMRTNAEECEKIALDICSKLALSKAQVSLFIPLKGVSSIAVAGGPFHDPIADEALFSTIRNQIPRHVELVELDHAINDAEFSRALATKLITYIDQS